MELSGCGYGQNPTILDILTRIYQTKSIFLLNQSRDTTIYCRLIINT